MQKTYKITITIKDRDHSFTMLANTPEEAAADVSRIYGVPASKVELVDDRIYYSDY